MLGTETFSMLSEYISNINVSMSRSVFAFLSVWAWKLVKKYARMAGLPDTIHPHTLRHSYAVRMVRSGTDLRNVQMLLGHANLNTTQVYLQFNDHDLRDGYNKIEFPGGQGVPSVARKVTPADVVGKDEHDVRFFLIHV